MTPRITWTGNLATDESLEGTINSTRVAAIGVVEGRVTLAFLDGLSVRTTPVRSLKRAKELAEEVLLAFLSAINARFYQEDELVLVEALRANQGGNDDQFLLLLREIWEKRHMDTAEKIHFIEEHLDELRIVTDFERRRADAQG